MCRRLKLTGAISVLLLAGLSLFEIVLYHLSLYLCFVGTPQPATAVLMKQSHIALWETFKRSLCSFSVVLDHACAWFNSHSTEDAPVVFFACFFLSARINNCAGVRCQNGGTCQDGANTFSCSCAAGYTGQYCQSKSVTTRLFDEAWAHPAVS